MNGDQLVKFRIKQGKNQREFYMELGYHCQNGNLVENFYGKKAIPKGLETLINEKYGGQEK
jgi:hypothetical protein